MTAPIKEARSLLAYALEHFEKLAAVPSATGAQLERLRLGLSRKRGESSAWAQHQRMDDQLARTFRYGHLLGALGREELAVVRASLDPVAVGERVVQVRSGDLVAIDRLGGEIIGATRKFDGVTLVADEGCVFVSTPVPLRRTQPQVARLLGLTIYQVRERMAGALAKVREHASSWREEEWTP